MTPTASVAYPFAAQVGGPTSIRQVTEHLAWTFGFYDGPMDGVSGSMERVDRDLAAKMEKLAYKVCAERSLAIRNEIGSRVNAMNRLMEMSLAGKQQKSNA